MNLRFTLFFSFVAISIATLSGQVLLDENFESGQLPAGWEIQTSASDGGWIVGSVGAISSQNFAVPANGSSNIIGSNDDSCNCNKSNDLLTTPPIDLSGQGSVVLTYDVLYTDNTYGGIDENATVEISLDGGTSWTIIEEIPGANEWVTYGISLSDYVGQSSVMIGFRYTDGGGWLYGIGLDNISVREPAALDVELVELTSPIFGEVGKEFPLEGSLINAGGDPITELEFTYTINSGIPTVETLDNLNISAFENYTFVLQNAWLPETEGNFTVEVTITAVNGGVDENVDNNTLSFTTDIFGEVIVPNKISEFISGGTPEITEISGASVLLNGPTDLDFFPVLGRDQLWVINEEVENTGGSTVMITGAVAGNPTFDRRVDGNAWHFMSLPTAIAFSDDNFNFATSPGVQDANHSGGTFTGPSLWSSDLDIYAMPSGGNGSHLDMLHGSPLSRGIAHEVDNVFWVYDDWNKDIVRYDFVDDHGPGNDYHADALVRRYSNMGISGDSDIPNHMIIDKSTGWLYIVDNGTDRVLRLDINSGAVSFTLPLINEPLTEHSAMGGFTFETIISDGLDRPSGIEIIGNRLLVGDYANGDIKVYDMDNDYVEIGTISTGQEGLTGIKVGPDGNIWYTNKLQNSVNVALPGNEISNTVDQLREINLSVNPNPTSDVVNVKISNLDHNSKVSIVLTNISGQEVYRVDNASATTQVDLSPFHNGSYLLTVQNDKITQTELIILNKQ